MYNGVARPRYVGPAYRYSPGCGYRTWSTGQVLPSVFLTSAYVFTAYATLGPAAPQSGYQWVR